MSSVQRLFFAFALTISFSGHSIEKEFPLFPRWQQSEGTSLTIDGPKSNQTRARFEKIEVEDLPSLALEGVVEHFSIGLRRQRKQCSQSDLGQTREFGDRVVSKRVWCLQSIDRLLEILESNKSWSAIWSEVVKSFEFYRESHPILGREAHFTGYYLPTLYGSFAPTDRFFYPLYLRPDDLKRVRVNGKWRWRRKLQDGSYTLYPTRYQIDYENYLTGKDLEIVYVDDYVSAFFLHIQGSGYLEMGDGAHFYVTYNGQNGRAYTSISKILKEDGVDRRYWSSMQGLRQYFLDFPPEKDRVLPQNESYIFFRRDNSGVKGSLGVYLVAGHSMAIDPKHYPYGAVTLVNAVKTVIQQGEEKKVPFSRLFITQDTGGAIRGPLRADLFWGGGSDAALIAGKMNDRGQLIVMIVKE